MTSGERPRTSNSAEQLSNKVHLLHESRGAVLEVVVSRMRTTARASPIRVVALSATVRRLRR